MINFSMEQKRSFANKFRMSSSFPQRGIDYVLLYRSIHGDSEEMMISNKSEPEEEKFPPIML